MKKLALVGLFALSSASIVHAGEIAELYQKTVGSKPTEKPVIRDYESTRNQQTGITEIGLERTRCYGACPAYSVVIKSDGSVRYKGEAHVKNIGVRKGMISSWQFQQLAKFIKEVGYMDLKNAYTVGITDNPTVYSTVKIGAKRKVISNYANSGPSKLWAVEQLIDKLVLETEWDNMKPKP